jgi:hypothetical protein
MKTISQSLLALVLGAATFTAIAQDAPPQGEGRPGRGPGGGGPGRSPVIAALDANGDGVIDAAEINGAAKALLALDKNGDGQLTAEEIRPGRPDGQRGPGGPGGPEGGRGEGKRPQRKAEAQ